MSVRGWGGNGVSRRNILRTAAGAAGVLALPAIGGIRRARASDTKVLKVIPEVDLKILDPIWTTATVTSICLSQTTSTLT